ncbi:MAG: DEAD/DEAH box helicase [Burkholderiaceae bacterium]|nr:DEAD/DEAH box helicase [Burkholderiaceae bacterium]
MNFEELNLATALVQAVKEQGYTQPTPIQEQAIPLVLAGHDLLAGAQTGTGKTAAFALPMLDMLSRTPAAHPRATRALVLTPTRELAAQVEDAMRVYGKHLPLKSTVIFGGVGMNPQIERMQSGVDILVATPGRLLDLQNQGHLDLSHVEILVLDEADRMLDMGFIHDVKKVLALLPAQKQSLLFSATFSDDIRALAASLLKTPRSVQVTPPNTTVERIQQVIYPVGRERKKEVLVHLIESGNWNQVLIFTRTKWGANHVAEYLTQHGIKAMALHGNKSQTARTQALAEFKSGELRALVATDIAARGIDIDDLPHVVNYEIPNVPEDYVHRIGRTGRAGASGEAVSLVCMDEEGFMMSIERFTKQQIPVKILDGFGPAEGERAAPIAMGRQTLWGGLGAAPGREVMQQAARAARQEMAQRLRENKARQGGGRRNPNTRGNPAAAPGNNAHGEEAHLPSRGTQQDINGRMDDGDNRNNPQRRRRRGSRRGPGATITRSGNSHQTPRQAPPPVDDFDDDRDLDQLPRHIDPLQTNLHGRRRENRGPSHGAVGQPDPMRTSIDMMSRSGNGGGNRNRNRTTGAGRSRPGGGGGNRSGGGLGR